MVDESIAALQEDMIPIQESLKQAELNVANHTGRVETLQEQINTAITESTERSQKKAGMKLLLGKELISVSKMFS